MNNKDFQNGFAIGLASGGIVEQEYILPIGGEELGGVKNGGNVVINEDGTMTAPEDSGTADLEEKISLKQDILVSGENIKTINGNNVLGEGDVFISEEWELIKSVSDVELRSVAIANDGKYLRYAIRFSGKAKTANSKWKMVLDGYSAVNLDATIGTHPYGSGAWFFVELPKNAPAFFSASDSTGAGAGAGILRQAYVGGKSSNDFKSFGLVPYDISLEYDSLDVSVWGVKA